MLANQEEIDVGKFANLVTINAETHQINVALAAGHWHNKSVPLPHLGPMQRNKNTISTILLML